jgi:hypothetical protein
VLRYDYNDLLRDGLLAAVDAGAPVPTYTDLCDGGGPPSNATARGYYGGLLDEVEVFYNGGGGWGGCANIRCDVETGNGTNEEWCADVLFALYAVWTRVLDLRGVDWFVEGKYMLDALRDPGSIPADRDVDFGVPVRALLELQDPAVVDLLATHGLHTFIDHEWGDARVCLGHRHPAVPSAYLGEPGPRPDIYLDMAGIGYTDRYGGVVEFRGFPCPLRACEPDLYPTRAVAVAGEVVRVPAEAEAYAAFTYGPRWRDAVGQPWETDRYECTPGGGFAAGVPVAARND